ncbi:MAG: hypothetical protein Q9M39_02730 [Sulfurovum sp.]|nr:hypothetical protein [Sulfurovum sp.]
MTYKISKYLIVIAALTSSSSIILCAEPSVYGFGNMDDSSPQEEYSSDYSTSSSTSSARGSSGSSMSAMQRKIAQQDERIDGLTTIIEGLSASLNELQMRGGQSSLATTNLPNDDLLKKLAGMIDDINANYVSKEELHKALGNKQYSKPSKTTANSLDSLESKTNATLYSEGVRLFVKKRYTDAQKRFAITDVKRYKPAASNYYLGEIAYYTKKYEDAIFYFKKSAGLYDKASYIDTLLLHTAVSLEKTGDKGQARAFYENIIENYSQNKSASIAKDRLRKL